MVILQTLGRIRLIRSDGTEIDELLRQPKRLALLAYLCSPKPGVWHRRDVLLAVFWSELDAHRARTALRNALYVLRQHLGDGVVRTRGDEEVCIDAEQLTSDVALLELDLAAGRFEEALERCAGDALPGLHIPAAGGFEGWLDEERVRIRALAKSAGLGLADARERSNDLEGAVAALTRTARLDPIDESVVRRMMSLHDRAGDRARALVVYDQFRSRVAAEFDAEPAPETVQLADTIRARRSRDRPAPSEFSQPLTSIERLESAEPPEAVSTQPPASSPLAGQIVPTVSRAISARRFRPRRVARVARVLAGSTAAIAILTSWNLQTPDRPRTLIVMPMENATGRADADYLATGIDDEIATRLRGMGGLVTTKSAARAIWPDSARNDLTLVGQTFGVEVAFRSRLGVAGDSLVVTGDVVDLASGRARDIGRHAFIMDSAQDVASRVAAAIAGRLFRPSMPEIPRGFGVRRVDPESFRLTLLGWHALLGRNHDVMKARDLFEEATGHDPTNARAWAGLSSSWASLAMGDARFEEAAARAEAAADRALALDPLEGTAWMNLAVVHGIRLRSLRVAERLFARAIAVDPGNPEIYLVKAAVYRHAGHWNESQDALQIAKALDPLWNFPNERESVVALCGDDPKKALDLYRRQIDLDAKNAGAHRGAARALARMGEWNEAITELRLALPGISLADSRATGDSGYWSLVHADGKKRLATALERKRTDWVSPIQLAGLRIASGDIEGGLDEFEKAAAAAELGAYRAPCQPMFDEVRAGPRFQRIIAALPPWELP